MNRDPEINKIEDKKEKINSEYKNKYFYIYNKRKIKNGEFAYIIRIKKNRKWRKY